MLSEESGIGDGTRKDTPVPSRPVVALSTGAMPVITPPSKGEAGLVTSPPPLSMAMERGAQP